MEVKILKENLQMAINLVSRFSDQSGQMPGLAYVELVAKDKEMYFQASDLRKSIKLRVAGKVVEEGRILVPAKLMVELVQALPLGVVNLNANESELALVAGKMKAKLHLGEIEDFPNLSEVDDKMVSWGEVPVSEVEKAWNGVKFVVSKDDSRPVLTGGLWEVSRGRLVATDGYRLSVVDDMVKLKKSGSEIDKLLLPGDLWQETLKVLTELGVESVGVSLNDEKGQVRFEAAEFSLVGSLIEGDYPNYRAIIPKEFKTVLRLGREELLGAVRAAAIFARDSANIVKMSIGEQKVAIAANTPKLGEGEIELEAEVVKMAEVIIAFNSKYLIDYLTNSSSERVELGVNDPLQPAQFEGLSKGEYKHVIMPVRVKSD